MIKRILVIWLFLFLIPSKILAADNFSSSYDVIYDISEDGTALISKKITLRNLNKDYYPDNFKLTVNSTQISDVKAADSTGSLETILSRMDNATQITVRFTQQVIGLNKELPWSLSFKSGDFVLKSGKVLEVKIPKIPSTLNMDTYTLTVTVPSSLGEPASIIPDPVSRGDNANKKTFRFGKNQMLNTGVSITFGGVQFFNFDLNYHLQNNNILPSLKNIMLPPDTDYQDVWYKDINPKPLNVTADEDGNFLAWYRLKRAEKINIKVSGSAKLYLNSKVSKPFLDNSLRQKYLITDKSYPVESLDKILGKNPPKEEVEKARLIYQYVVNSQKTEPTPLFVALARSAGIPARVLAGFAYAANRSLRPTFPGKDILGSWPEYFDEKKGWVMVDPTWEQTSGGVNFFDKLDLNHFVFAIRNASPINALTGMNVFLGETDFIIKPKLDVNIQISSPIWALFPSRATIKISNRGNSAFFGSDFQVNSQNLNIAGDVFNTGIIPPFGTATFDFNVKSKSLFDSFDDQIILSIGKQKFYQDVKIVPFVIFQTLPFISGVILMGMWGVYLVIVGVFIHRKRFNKKKSSRKK